MFCANCGSPARNGAQFCDRCGKELLRPTEPPSPKPPAYHDVVLWRSGEGSFFSRLTREGICLFLGLFVLGALWIYALNYESPSNRALTAKRETVQRDWSAYLERGQTQLKKRDYRGAQTTFNEMLDAKPNDSEVRKLLGDADVGVKKLETAEAKNRQQEAKVVSAKKVQIKELVEQFVASLPSLEGRQELITAGATNYGVRTCHDATHSHRISWLNKAKTKAKVSVTRHCRYPVEFGQLSMITTTKDYRGGTFNCEEAPDGTWRFVQ
ncbi:MAG: hypothetical protein A2X35_09300 [Elusimicrobia bacterium GWA2_61_42]|nr:MAG: hypothetical protein A2X35_09300 [Elusimicrobia bacterium GWA2_61_42]